MSTDRQMASARATAARDAAPHGMPVKPVGAMSNWEIFKSAFRRDNPLYLHNRCWGAGILVVTAGLAYLIKRAEEIQREMATNAKASSARSAAAAHTGYAQHSPPAPPLPRK